jgi:hypothetical protein
MRWPVAIACAPEEGASTASNLGSVGGSVCARMTGLDRYIIPEYQLGEPIESMGGTCGRMR